MNFVNIIESFGEYTKRDKVTHKNQTDWAVVIVINGFISQTFEQYSDNDQNIAEMTECVL